MNTRTPAYEPSLFPQFFDEFRWAFLDREMTSTKTFHDELLMYIMGGEL